MWVIFDGYVLKYHLLCRWYKRALAWGMKKRTPFVKIEEVSSAKST